MRTEFGRTACWPLIVLALCTTIALLETACSKSTAVADARIISETSVAIDGIISDTTSDAAATPGIWRLVSSNTSADLHDVIGMVFGEKVYAFAVGGNGTILALDNGVWSKVANSPTNATLWGVWGQYTGNYFVVGDNAAIYHFKNGNWHDASQKQKLGQQSFRGIVGTAENNIIAFSTYWEFDHYAGTIDRHDGTTHFELGLEQYDWTTWKQQWPMNAVWSLSPTSTVAVGKGAAILRFDGANWIKEKVSVASGIDFLSVWGADMNNIWALGTNGVARKWSSQFGAWSSTDSFSNQSLDLSGYDTSNIFNVGKGGEVCFSQGAPPQYKSGCLVGQYRPTTNNLSAVWASKQLVIVVGDNGTILHYVPR